MCLSLLLAAGVGLLLLALPLLPFPLLPLLLLLLAALLLRIRHVVNLSARVVLAPIGARSAESYVPSPLRRA